MCPTWLVQSWTHTCARYRCRIRLKCLFKLNTGEEKIMFSSVWVTPWHFFSFGCDDVWWHGTKLVILGNRCTRNQNSVPTNVWSDFFNCTNLVNAATKHRMKILSQLIRVGSGSSSTEIARVRKICDYSTSQQYKKMLQNWIKMKNVPSWMGKNTKGLRGTNMELWIHFGKVLGREALLAYDAKKE